MIEQGTLVGQGSSSELAGRLGSRQRVILRVDAPPDEVRACLASIADVDRVAMHDGAYVIEAPGTLPLARRVGAAMAARSWVIEELRQESLALEDVVLQLVRGGAGS